MTASGQPFLTRASSRIAIASALALGAISTPVLAQDSSEGGGLFVAPLYL